MAPAPQIVGPSSSPPTNSDGTVMGRRLNAARSRQSWSTHRYRFSGPVKPVRSNSPT
jgi:hypothetical protein